MKGTAFVVKHRKRITCEIVVCSHVLMLPVSVCSIGYNRKETLLALGRVSPSPSRVSVCNGRVVPCLDVSCSLLLRTNQSPSASSIRPRSEIMHGISLFRSVIWTH